MNHCSAGPRSQRFDFKDPLTFPIRTPPLAASALISLAAIGCSGSSSHEAGGAEDLSYELVQQTIDPARTLELEEIYRVGTYDGPIESQIYNSWAAVLAPSGDPYVLDTGNDRVTRFGASFG